MRALKRQPILVYVLVQISNIRATGCKSPRLRRDTLRSLSWRRWARREQLHFSCQACSFEAAESAATSPGGTRGPVPIAARRLRDEMRRDHNWFNHLVLLPVGHVLTRPSRTTPDRTGPATQQRREAERLKSGGKRFICCACACRLPPVLLRALRAPTPPAPGAARIYEFCRRSIISWPQFGALQLPWSRPVHTRQAGEAHALLVHHFPC